MMPTIRIDDEVYDRLKEEAEAFVDTPNTVLRRLLSLDPHDDGLEVATALEPSSNPRARTGELLERKEYDLPILEVLDRLGGSGHPSDVVAEAGKIVAEKLTERDRQKNRSGAVRWESRIRWRRFGLVKLGLLKGDSPRGIWEISDAGRDALKAGEINYPALHASVVTRPRGIA